MNTSELLDRLDEWKISIGICERCHRGVVVLSHPCLHEPGDSLAYNPSPEVIAEILRVNPHSAWITWARPYLAIHEC